MNKKSIVVLFFVIISFSSLHAQTTTTDDDRTFVPFMDLQVREPQSGREVAFSLQLLILIAIITLSPSIIVLTTSFLRIAIVFDFIKRALSLQQVPPNQVVFGVALFLTVFVMWPVFQDIYEDAFKPLANEEITMNEFYKNAEAPLRMFMFRQLDNNHENLQVFWKLSGKKELPQTLADIPTYILIPAFVLNELKIAFWMGILIYLPFIVIDLVVSSILMSMGMIMLPPVMISLPFKLLLFVLVDGWTLITRQVVLSFGGG